MIGITLGDPSGIGPEIVVKTLREAARDDVVVFGDRGVLERAGGLAAGARFVEVTALSADEARPGAPTLAGAEAQVAYLEAAIDAARRGEIGALVTAPISKSQAKRAGLGAPGHTELLAERLGVPAGPGRPAEHAMMFVGPRLRVVLATIHLPLAGVPSALTADRVASAAVLGAESLARDFGFTHPRVGVVGLNPHAGEGGLFGDEEERAIRPGIAQAAERAPFATFHGPLVPDAAFRAALAPGAHDLLVAMYHDQGLIPVKLVDFEESVNVTLGLSIVRTSPDHGVAYDIAGRGVARHRSFAAALSLARAMSRHRSQEKVI